jgi:hypothetical protein
MGGTLRRRPRRCGMCRPCRSVDPSHHKGVVFWVPRRVCFREALTWRGTQDTRRPQAVPPADNATQPRAEQKKAEPSRTATIQPQSPCTPSLLSPPEALLLTSGAHQTLPAAARLNACAVTRTDARSCPVMTAGRQRNVWGSTELRHPARSSNRARSRKKTPVKQQTNRTHPPAAHRAPSTQHRTPGTGHRAPNNHLPPTPHQCKLAHHRGPHAAERERATGMRRRFENSVSPMDRAFEDAANRAHREHRNPRACRRG